MTDIITDLCERMHVLHLRHLVVFEPSHPADGGRVIDMYVPRAEALVRGLIDSDHAAVVIVRSLVDPGDMGEPTFWGTPLGRLLFCAGGYERQTCTQTEAAAVLGCSRQWISAMVGEGKLDAAEGRRVRVDQVCGVLKARADRLGVDAIVK
jgi:hypothetical protein